MSVETPTQTTRRAPASISVLSISTSAGPRCKSTSGRARPLADPQRASLPRRMSMDSLAGLNVDELRHLSRASAEAIIRLIAGVSGGRIDRVRSVQPLQQCVLLFSKVLPLAEDPRERAGGRSGPERRFG